MEMLSIYYNIQIKLELGLVSRFFWKEENQRSWSGEKPFEEGENQPPTQHSYDAWSRIIHVVLYFMQFSGQGYTMA